MKRKPGTDSDDVRVVDERGQLRRRLPWVVVVIAVALAVFVLIEDMRRPKRAPERHAAALTATPPTAPAPTERRVAPAVDLPHSTLTRPTRVRRTPPAENAKSKAAPPESGEVNGAEDRGIGAREYIEALREAGETEGLAAFPPPGTRPPRSGVIVPADYVLPEGFARHHQTTDDGRRLDPILVVAPGYELVDHAGNPVPLADDRIVPPELAPPDLRVRLLEIPSDYNAAEGSD